MITIHYIIKDDGTYKDVVACCDDIVYAINRTNRYIVEETNPVIKYYVKTETSDIEPFIVRTPLSHNERTTEIQAAPKAKGNKGREGKNKVFKKTKV